MRIKILILIMVIVLGFCCIYLPVATNLWLFLIEHENLIPKESSIFTFIPTVMNSGSGDWWTYGEDGKNYYYFSGVGKTPYVLISKKQAKKLKGFKTDDYTTWK